MKMMVMLILVVLSGLPSGTSWAAQAAAGGAAQTPAQVPASGAATVAVGGDVKTPLSVTADELKTMPRTRVEVQDEGRTVVYEGVLVAELLKKAGAPLGAELRGNAIASYVLATASDGYQALFSLAELDPAFTSNNVIVADSIDGKPLFAYQGPLRLVAPKDSRGARSLRMLTKIELVRVKK
jgi:DMSO/TMAO reductase YedYZ molybdopterin-dependent catalytic subunit